MIRIVNIDQLSDNAEAERVEYFVEFDDGSRYEGVTDAEGFGDGDGLDNISYLRIGDEYECFEDFVKDIHGEEVEVTHHPIAKAKGRYTISSGGNIEDCDSLDAYASEIEDARNGKGGLSIFDNKNQEMLFFKYDGREVYIDNLK